MKIKFKKLREDAVIPKKGTEGSSGFDLYSLDITVNGMHVEMSTGIAIEIPEGYEVQVRPRSSALKSFGLNVILGTIDSDYRGEIRIQALIMDQHNFNVYNSDFDIKTPIRVAQLVFVKLPEIELEEVGILNETVRGSSGFGSTG